MASLIMITLICLGAALSLPFFVLVLSRALSLRKFTKTAAIRTAPNLDVLSRQAKTLEQQLLSLQAKAETLELAATRAGAAAERLSYLKDELDRATKKLTTLN